MIYIYYSKIMQSIQFWVQWYQILHMSISAHTHSKQAHLNVTGATGKKPYWKIALFFFSLLLVCLYCSFIALHFFHVANFLQVFWYQSLRPHLPNTQFKAVMCNDDDVANLPVLLPAYPRKKKKESAIKWTTNLSFLSKYFHEKCQKCKS